MKKIVLLICAILIYSGYATDILAQKNKKNNKSQIQPLHFKKSDNIAFVLEGKTYYIGDILKHLIEENRNIQIVLYDAATADSDYLKFQKKYSPFLQLEGGYKNQENPEDIHQFAGTKLRERTADIAISKSFSSGTTFSTGLRHTYQDNIDKNPSFGDVTYHQPVFYASIEQELLKNFMGYQDRRQQNILKNADKIVKELTVYQTSSMTLNAISNAWNLALRSSELDNNRLKLSETIKVRRIIQRNVSYGLNERFDLNYWNAQVAGREAEVKGALYNFNEAARQVKLDFNMPLDYKLDPYGMVILQDNLPQLSQEQALQIAYSNRADYQNALLTVKNAEMQLDIYRNEALPSLKASFTASSMGERDNIDDAYSDAFEGKDPGYEVNLQMTYPLDDTEQKANVRDSRIALKQAKLDLEEIKKSVKKDVLDSIEAIETAYVAYTKAKNARVQSEIYYVRLRAYLRRGRFSASVVKDALDAMVDSRQRELDALINYNVTLLRFDIVQNQLFKKYNIDIYHYINDKKQ